MRESSSRQRPFISPHLAGFPISTVFFLVKVYIACTQNPLMRLRSYPVTPVAKFFYNDFPKACETRVVGPNQVEKFALRKWKAKYLFHTNSWGGSYRHMWCDECSESPRKSGTFKSEDGFWAYRYIASRFVDTLLQGLLRSKDPMCLFACILHRVCREIWKRFLLKKVLKISKRMNDFKFVQNTLRAEVKENFVKN